MSGHSHDQHMTPEQDRALARAELDKGDLKHGAFHAACGIGEEPVHADSLALLERMAALGKRPEELYPLDGQVAFGEAATRAWLDQRAGHHDAAINLLGQVIGVRPDLPFTAWLKAWTSDATVVAALDPDQLAGSLSRAIEGAREASDESVARRACAELADVTAVIRRHHAAVSHLAGLHCRALRRAGKTAEAVAVCEAEDERAPTYMSAVFLGGSRRDHGDLAGAREAYRAAWEREGSNASILLDVGDVSMDLRDHAAAIAAYQEALTHGEGEHWAPASIAYCKWLQDGGGEHRDVLEQRADAGEARARHLLRLVTPYDRWLPDPVESVISVARQIAAGQITSAPLSFAISSIEAPSAVAEMLAYCRARFGREPTLSMNVPSPDPRLERRAGGVVLWMYENDFRPVPAVVEPSADVAERVARLAATRFDRGDWFDAAGEMTAGLDEDAAGDLLAAMVYSSPAPDGMEPWDWRRRVQVAAAMGLAWLPGGPDAALARLRSLVDGHVDWTGTAALIVLCEVASRSSAHTELVAQIFEEVHGAPEMPVIHMCLRRPVIDLALQLPDRTPEFIARWRARRAALAD
jgi:tetratricopeptide (TPR) repeat protein